MDNKKISAKDLINVGIFTAIYIVVFFASSMLCYIPILVVVQPLVSPVICGIPFMLYLTKVKKFGMLSLTGIICGLLMMLMGSGIYVLITGVVFGIVADLILKSSNYEKMKSYFIASGVFSMWLMGIPAQMFLSRDTYFANLAGVYGQEFVDSLMNFTPMWVFPAMFILCFIGGIIGAFIGKAALSKHFKKAGIV